MDSKKHKIINGYYHKNCISCKSWLPATEENFYSVKKNKDGLHSYCKACVLKKAKESMLKNYDKQLERMRERNLLPGMKKAKKKYNSSLKKKKTQQIWQEKNKLKLKNYRLQRDAHKKHNITDVQWQKCKDYFNNKCAYCGLKIEDHKILFKGTYIQSDFHKEHVDHKGANDISNCIPACKSCNSSKHDFAFEEWYNSSNKNFSSERLLKIKEWLNRFKAERQDSEWRTKG
ncbi:HNH endonuclease signature motif containing protein [Bacillus subtilis]|uniref:HNH endonuclease signature motif containing protein n=1 Tax=Bacillus subtilis TaxID=1423 RepID=UPI0011A12301|nr:HNH endonuclease signature motif containing protein [Bacillus subtilis]